jgi:capsular exopolysaccharide synthesis family protein
MKPKSAYLTSPVTMEIVNPDAIRTAAKVEFRFSPKDSTVIIGSKKYPLNQTVVTEWGQLKFVKNRRYKDKPEGQLYFTLLNPGVVAGGYKGKLKIISSKVSTVVTMKINDAVPERGEDVLNELIAVYNKATIDDKNRLASSTFAFVNERLKIVEEEMKEIEQKAQAYKSSRGAVELGTQSQIYLNSMSGVDQRLGEVSMQIAVLDQIQKYVQSKDKTGSIVPSTLGLNDGMLTDLLNKMYEHELNYEKLKKTVGENNPMLTSIREQINKIKPSILENIQNQRKNLEATKLNLHSTSNTFTSQLQTIPQKERELIEINRQQSIKNGIYTFLLQKKEESELSHASTIVDSRVVDRAHSSFDPVSPKRGMIYMVAFFLSMALPAGFIAAKGMLNRKIIFRSQIENLTSFPIIGEIIHDKGKEPLVIKEGKRTFIAEQFRRIRTSLGYLGIHPGKKKILVTSSLSGEGKSFVAVNLALSLAMTGKKVILLELDLANPSLSDKLKVKYEQGVSNYLWGECEPEEIIKRSAENANLFFLPAGPLPDNPSELLMSEKLKDLLDYLEAIFDNIIIDSAPASLLSDAYVLSPLCDATLYVVKHRFTPKVYLERLDHETTLNNLTNMGIIFNGIRSRGFTKNGYGYGYGYGYIHNPNGKKSKMKRKKKAVKQS